MKMHIPELLAPAGGLVQLQAAVNNGADAVYLGGARFNARGKAENFTLPRLRDAIAYAHERNVKINVTFNTLLKDRELPDALDYAGALWDIGADAVIVQDMGLVRLLGKYLPDLPLHLSTQGTVTSKWAVDLMKDWGIRRIVPARELTLQEIREMAAACHGTGPVLTPGQGRDTRDGAGGTLAASDLSVRRAQTCELEVFVHGALCMCYSGQCQMSRLLGATGGKGSTAGARLGNGHEPVKESAAGARSDDGQEPVKGSARSGNRGLCAQPCRLPYTDDQGRTRYFLSPKDLCLLEDIPALCDAGVDSLKIEGRLKSPEYVAVVTSIYRKYLDQFAEHGYIKVSQEDRQDLTQIYNRGGFTKGYLYGNPGEKILSGASPKNTGIYIGTVQSVVDPKHAGPDRAAAAGAARKDAALVDVKLQASLAEGDGVEFRPAGSTAEETGKKGGRNMAARANRQQNVPQNRPLVRRPLDRTETAGGVVTFRRELPGGILRIGDMKGQVTAGDSVFRVTDKALLERARATFDTEDPAELDRRMRRPIPLKMSFTAAAGQPAVLEIREKQNAGENAALEAAESLEAKGRINEAAIPRDSDASPLVRICSQTFMEIAQKRPADPERIRQQLGKLGGTPFAAADEDIDVSLDGVCIVPIGEINRMRREGIDQLLHEKRQVRRIPADDATLAAAGKALEEQKLYQGTVLWPTSVPQMEPDQETVPRPIPIPLMEWMEHAAAEANGEQDTIEETGSEAVPDRTASPTPVVLPYIDAVSKGRLDAYVEANFSAIVARLKATDTGILIRGNSWIRQLLDAGVTVYGGHGLNIYNEEARRAYEELGVQVLELSHETGLAGLDPQGRIPLMVTEHPVQSKTLTDRKGVVHQIERSATGDKTIIW